MKFLLILIAFTWGIGKAQTNKTTGQLIDFTEAKIPAYCGYQIEYGVLKVILDNDISNLKAGDTIYIFQTCPREIMEREVGSYYNNHDYLVDIGKEVKKPDLLKAVKVFRKEYSGEQPSTFFYGYLSKLK